METDIKDLKSVQKEIKTELKYMWEGIKKLDSRLSMQEEETFMLKRIK